MFYLKDSKKIKTSIYCIIRYKGKRYKIATGESVSTAFWNPEKHRCYTGKRYPEGAIINDRLNNFKIRVENIFNEYKLNNQIPTINEVKNKLNGREDEITFFFDEFIHQYIDAVKHEKAESTIKKYITTLHKIEEYQNDTDQKLRFQDIDINFYRDFKAWFYTKYNTRNYFGSIIKNIKRFMNAAALEGLHNCKGYKHPEFKTEAEDADTVYLTIDELKKIYQLKITEDLIKQHYPNITAGNLKRKIESLEKVRARFLIGAFTLLRVSDYKRLTEVNVKGSFIKIKPKKRSKGRKNRDVVIPMHPIVKDILKKGYDLSESISEQKINKHIKEICRMAGITSKEVIYRTEKGKEVEKSFEKWELITTHTARRSAATNMLMAGMEASDIMILGGWSSEKSFWKYIRLEPEVNAKRLSNHPFFKKI